MSNLTSCVSKFIETLVIKGLRHVVLSPGSRNFPLINGFLSSSEVTCHSVIDERSAGFVALGMAQKLKTPVAVCCTSGTAALNLYPSIAEAYYSEIPLIVLTADRPSENIDNWEGQCIRQTHIFAQHILASFETSDDYTDSDRFREVAETAYSKASQGPVHVNMPFREPFYYQSEPKNAPNDIQENDDIQTYGRIPDRLINDLKEARRILWLNGASLPMDEIPLGSNRVVFSDVISNQPDSIQHWDGILSSKTSLEERYSPDLIISTGKFFVSKPLRTWLKGIKNLTHWHIGTEKDIPTPFGTRPKTAKVEFQHIIDRIQSNPHQESYLNVWQELQKNYTRHFSELGWNQFNEFSAIRKVHESLPVNSILHVANSMPVRYLGFLKKKLGLTYYSNRGTSGIDGCTSTALGYAKISEKNVFLITGDIAFFYDCNGFWVDHVPPNFKIVLMNNNGGGIFQLIDGPNEFSNSLTLQTTPHNRSAQHLCNDYGLAYFKAENWHHYEIKWDEFLNHSGAAVFEIQTNMKTNKEFYDNFRNIELT